MQPEISSASSLRTLVFVCSISLQFIYGFSNGTASGKNGKVDDSHGTSHHGTGTKVLIVCVAIVAVVLFSLFLFKLWQKKKQGEQYAQEEQYARLLKLFEEDDELEVELGLRD
ncbi:hypothetical protein Ancab_025806 [Ancistrocladus abbreviatus]